MLTNQLNQLSQQNETQTRQLQCQSTQLEELSKQNQELVKQISSLNENFNNFTARNKRPSSETTTSNAKSSRIEYTQTTLPFSKVVKSAIEPNEQEIMDQDIQTTQQITKILTPIHNRCPKLTRQPELVQKYVSHQFNWKRFRTAFRIN